MSVIPNSSLPMEVFSEATARVNELRGRCLDAFARIEAAVTECLVIMAETESRGKQVRLPHLIGQRLDALAAVIEPGGAFEQEGNSSAAALEKCRGYISLRNTLCHGSAKITLDAKGQWTAVFRLVGLRSKQVHRDVLVITEDEGEELRDTLIGASKDICSRLGQVRVRLKQ